MPTADKKRRKLDKKVGQPPSQPRQTGVGDMVTIGTREYAYGVPGSKLQPMDDANHLLGDPAALMTELNEKGYLLIRGLHDRAEVLAARRAVLGHLHDLGGKLDGTQPWEDGVLLQGCGAGCVPFMEGRQPLAEHDPAKRDTVMKVLEGRRPHEFFSSLLGEPCTTFDYKWLRAMYTGGFTGAHTDSVYMSRGTPNLYTLWTPIGDVDTQMGTIAVAEASNRSPGFQQLRDTYSAMDAEAENLDGTGWFTTDSDEILSRFGGVWKTTDFRAGDVLLFTMQTVHMSTSNTTGFARISCDTRWQRKSEPADSRYTGNAAPGSLKKFGTHSSDDGGKGKALDLDEPSPSAAAVAKVTIQQKKAEWGFGECAETHAPNADC